MDLEETMHPEDKMENDVLENRLAEIPFNSNEEGCSCPKNRRKSKFSNCHLSDIVPKRFIFSCIGFLASTLAISLNTNLSIVIVSMVDRSNESLLHVKSSNECLLVDVPLEVKAEEKPVEINRGEFHWSPETEGLALGAVYYGQLFGFLPGGRMAEVYGGKRTLIAFLFLASLCTAAVPFAARLSVHVFIACRFLVGVGTAPVIPVLFYLISRWIPESERSFNASFILAGYGVGTFLSFLTSGMLCASDFLGGWPSVFYIGGMCGFAWCLLCYLFIYETPKDHPTITSKELTFISKHLGLIEQKQIKKIRWKSLLTSVPFWSLALGYFGQFWILGFYSTVQTLYMGTILNLDSITNGELSCVPPLARGVFACICGWPADIALKRGYVSKAFIRKGATIVNTVFSCAGFVAILLAGCNPVLNTIFFTVGGLLGDFITFGVCMGGVDIAPNLSGTVSGILNFVGVIPFFLIPALVGFTTKYERSMAQWRYVYYGTIGVVLLTTVIYCVFGTSEPQEWGTYDEEPDEEDSVDLTKTEKPENNP
ncbi:putative inorganic phosphate cotransporter isoform X1 [Argiope bruennichi]|uniref:putative inorganic phosphate cotransporter isoform X1 n=3 Tax=Argiope bruennichi TaxID=94029 RepID=UPI002495A189|nr:putative inorganic phosphate cotransporter isoform X1 [Argiope bruennichi]